MDYCFDSEKVAPRVVLQEGIYFGKIVDVEVKQTKDGKGQRVEIAIDVEGHKLFSGFNVVHSSEIAVKIAKQMLKECYISAFGKDCSISVLALLNSVIKVAIEKRISEQSKKSYFEPVAFFAYKTEEETKKIEEYLKTWKAPPPKPKTDTQQQYSRHNDGPPPGHPCYVEPATAPF